MPPSPLCGRRSRRWRKAGFVAAAVLGLTPAALAQMPDPSRVAHRLGLCQCTANHDELQTRCTVGKAACAKHCGGPIHSFLPLRRGALTICPPEELYVVLPNADGRPGAGAITVNDGKSDTVLSRAYAAAAGLRGGDTASLPIEAGEAQAIFRRALAARPILPRRFQVYFNPGRVDPGPAARAAFAAALADFRRRPAAEIEVIGHADTVAGDAINRKLSLDRANAVAAELVRLGVDQRIITIVGYGESNLPVPTRDGVAEPRNRRVEVIVR